MRRDIARNYLLQKITTTKKIPVLSWFQCNRTALIFAIDIDYRCLCCSICAVMSSWEFTNRSIVSRMSRDFPYLHQVRSVCRLRVQSSYQFDIHFFLLLGLLHCALSVNRKVHHTQPGPASIIAVDSRSRATKNFFSYLRRVFFSSFRAFDENVKCVKWNVRLNGRTHRQQQSIVSRTRTFSVTTRVLVVKCNVLVFYVQSVSRYFLSIFCGLSRPIRITSKYLASV